jgi:hypothetical protein
MIQQLRKQRTYNIVVSKIKGEFGKIFDLIFFKVTKALAIPFSFTERCGRHRSIKLSRVFDSAEQFLMVNNYGRPESVFLLA